MLSGGQHANLLPSGFDQNIPHKFKYITHVRCTVLPLEGHDDCGTLYLCRVINLSMYDPRDHYHIVLSFHSGS